MYQNHTECIDILSGCKDCIQTVVLQFVLHRQFWFLTSKISKSYVPYCTIIVHYFKSFFKFCGFLFEDEAFFVLNFYFRYVQGANIKSSFYTAIAWVWFSQLQYLFFAVTDQFFSQPKAPLNLRYIVAWSFPSVFNYLSYKMVIINIFLYAEPIESNCMLCSPLSLLYVH